MNKKQWDELGRFGTIWDDLGLGIPLVTSAVPVPSHDTPGILPHMTQTSSTFLRHSFDTPSTVLPLSSHYPPSGFGYLSNNSGRIVRIKHGFAWNSMSFGISQITSNTGAGRDIVGAVVGKSAILPSHQTGYYTWNGFPYNYAIGCK